jgi:hypothetical protein
MSEEELSGAFVRFHVVLFLVEFTNDGMFGWMAKDPLAKSNEPIRSASASRQSTHEITDFSQGIYRGDFEKTDLILPQAYREFSFLD